MPFKANADRRHRIPKQRHNVYAEVAARHPDAAVIVPPRSSAVLSDTHTTAPTRRDRHIKAIAERGRIGWQKASGYNWRALVEADIARLRLRRWV